MKTLEANQVYVFEVSDYLVVVCTYRNCQFNPDYNVSPHYHDKESAKNAALEHLEMEQEYYAEKGA